MAFIPADRAVPETLRTPEFVLRQLCLAVAELDYAAYTGSPDVIRDHSGGLWPVTGYTLDDERRELAQHEERHAARQDFSFILLTPDESAALGCVYILPLAPFLQRYPTPAASATDASAIITFWVRQEYQRSTLPEGVVAAVDAWVRTEWPFDEHLFRVNPAERRSLAALVACGLRVRFETTLDRPPHRYLFFGSDKSERNAHGS